jgi:EAL domain-containing protein (putative c-di-GMP-specific phosphodiesterase class I)
MFNEHASSCHVAQTTHRGNCAIDPKTRFELQAIVWTRDLSPYGYEFLYRGEERPTTSHGWQLVDRAVLEHLGRHGERAGRPLFVNLSHESLLSIPDRVLMQAAARNDVRFEISEDVADNELFDQVCSKVNRLTVSGLQFVIDDFGAGLDGCRRMYSLDTVSAVKIDRDLLASAARRPGAAGMLKASVAHWNSTGVMTIAEGVETRDLLDFATRTGFSLVQGWHVDTLVRSESVFI